MATESYSINVSNIIKQEKWLGFSDIYAESIGDADKLIARMPKSKLQDHLIFILHYDKDNLHDRSFETFLSQYFSPAENEISIVVNELFSAAKLRYGDFRICNTYSCLSLLERVLSRNEDFDDQIEMHGDYKFRTLLAVLAENENLNKFVSARRNELGTKPNRSEILRFFLSTNFAIHDIVNFNPSEHLTQSIKASYLFNFLESNSKTTRHYHLLLNAFGCVTWHELFMKFLEIYNLSLAANHTNNYTFDIKGNAQLLPILQQFVLLDIELPKVADFQFLRKNPLIRLSETAFQFTHLKFFLDKLYKGIYFKLDEINLNLGSDGLRDFKSVYSDDFNEVFLCGKIIPNAFPANCIKLPETEIVDRLLQKQQLSKKATPSLPDYYVRCGSNMFLFEVKDAFVSGELKVSMNADELEIFLRQRFNHQTATKKGQKGIPQLLGYAENILSNRLQYDEFDLNDTSKIFPILLLSDEIYNSLGLNYQLNLWHMQQVNDLIKENDFDPAIIQPLTVITIDTLILYYNHFSKGLFSLHQLIEYYISDCLRLGLEFEKKHPIVNQYIPFSAYVKNYMLDNKLEFMPEDFEDLFEKLVLLD